MAEETTTTTQETTQENTQSTDYKAEYERLQSEYAKLKASNDKNSSEVAEYKRKERERMSDDEKRKTDDEARENHYKELERKLAMREYEDELDDIYDEKIRGEIVEMLADGKVVEALKKHKEFRKTYKVELEKEIKANLLKQNPQPNAQSNGGASMTKEDIMKIKDASARQKAISEHINLFV